MVLFFCLAAVILAQQPNKQPQKQPKKQQKKFDWSKIYAEDDAKTTRFKRKEEPAFSLKKPSKKWHFIDIEKFKKIRLEAVKDEKGKERMKALMDATYCLLYREEKEATAVLLIITLQEEEKIDDIVARILQGLLKRKGYSLKSRKFFRKGGVRVCRLVYEIGEGQGKRMIERYLFVKGGRLWQFVMDCAPEDYKALKKEFSKLFKSLKH